jgi:hypothetical protein
MTMKRTDLAKNKFLKVNGRIHQAPTPGRFADQSAALPDRREQRRLDQAAGLVPFAVKLNGELVQEIKALAETRQLGLNEVVSELLRRGLDKS